MRSRHWMLFSVVSGLMMLLTVMLVLTPATITDAQPAFATNTPRPPDPLGARAQLPFEQYALRLWTPVAMLDVLHSQLSRLANGELEQIDAIRLTQYELSQRFPDEPRTLSAQQRILEAMLRTPRGTVDMRAVARPYLVTRFNQQLDVFPAEAGSLMIDDFLVQVTPLKINPDDLPDALLYLRYPSNIDVPARYEDFIVVQGTSNGYAMLPLPDSMIAAPLNTVENLVLVRTGDLNNDGLDEFAYRVLDTASVNFRLMIFGWRNGQIVDLAVTPIEYGRITDWDESTTTIRLMTFRLESPVWGCIAEQPVIWQYTNNFFRPQTALNVTYTPIDSLGCDLYLADPPIYLESPDAAIIQLQTLLQNADPFQHGYDQATVALGVLYYLSGQLREAQAYMAALPPAFRQEVAAFNQIASSDVFSPVQLCAALTACDVQQVLLRLLLENPISLVGDLRAQLTDLNLPVADLVQVTQPGSLPREYVRFAIDGAGWWVFAPTGDTFYEPSPTDQVPQGALPVTPPLTVIQATPLLYQSLLVENDPLIALSIVDNALQDNPGAVVSLEVQYIQALAYDLLGNRQQARTRYFELWTQAAGTVWGQLAGAHLEERTS